MFEQLENGREFWVCRGEGKWGIGKRKREMGVYIVRVGRQVFGKGNLRVSETQREYLLRGWESVCSFTSSKITFMKSFVHDNVIFMVKYLVIKF